MKKCIGTKTETVSYKNARKKERRKKESMNNFHKCSAFS